MVKNKLNNKGITTIEVLISFVLIAIIANSLYSTISAYNDRRIIENYKSEVLTYKNTITKTIQDDFIKIGLSSVNYNKTYGDYSTIYQVDCSLKDGTARRLIITQKYTKSDTHPNGDPYNDDYFMIEYGQPDLTKENADDQNANLIEYPIPDIGSYAAKFENEKTGKNAMDLVISNVLIDLGNNSSTKNNNVLSIYIGFYHPELSTRYSINIVSPINYIQSSTRG